MPRVYLSENERLCARLSSWIYGEIKIRGISQKVMATELGISQPAFYKKLKTHSFSYTDFLTIVRVLDPDESELIRLLGRGRK